MNPIDYLHLQLRLEGKSVIGNHLLRQVESVPGEEMPLLLIAQFTYGKSVAYYDEGLDPDLQVQLARRIQERYVPQIDPLLECFNMRDIPFNVEHYKTYLFPEKFFESHPSRDVVSRSREDPKVQAYGFGEFAKNVYVIERDGNIASACVSARENEFCGEAWVFTHPGYRHQGLAQTVVAAWASGLISAGKVPFYSHKLENNASASLARRLRLSLVFEVISLARLADG